MVGLIFFLFSVKIYFYRSLRRISHEIKLIINTYVYIAVFCYARLLLLIKYFICVVHIFLQIDGFLYSQHHWNCRHHAFGNTKLARMNFANNKHAELLK